jgi:hypothetical protein
VDFLVLPERVLALLPPRPASSPAFETFPRRTGLFFDPVAAASAAADLTVSALLNPARLARLQDFGDRFGTPGVGEVADGLVAATWGAAVPNDGARRQVLRAVQRVTVERLLEQATSHPVGQVRAILTDRLLSLAARLEHDPDAGAFERLAAADIRRWARRDVRALPPPGTPEAPAGSPIG